MSKNIVVIFGGVSSESEISVITGTMAANLLSRAGFCVFPVYITQSGEYVSGKELMNISAFKNGSRPVSCEVAFKKGGMLILSRRGKVKKFVPADCILNCCHGGWGEGGGVSGLASAMSIPLASAGVFESSLFMDKYLTKLVLSSLGVPVLEYTYLRDMSGATQIESYPVIVKPVHLGSSVGVAVARSQSELSAALSTAFALDDGVIVERYIADRREFNCAAYMAENDIVTSPVEEVKGGELLTYEDKYSGTGTRKFPADIPEELSLSIRGIAKKVYSSLNMRGIVRFDFIAGGDKVYVSEVNTVPGSLSSHLLAKGLPSFSKVLSAVISQALKDSAAQSQKLIINTGILNNLPSNACKIK